VSDTGLPDDLGDTCTEAADCSTNYCFARTGPDVCSLCAVNGDCGVQQRCAYSGDRGYAACVGTGNLGASCNTDQQCASTHCNQGVCSECFGDADCEGGGTCIDDRTGVGYFSCTGGLGDACQQGNDCGTGFCFDPPGGGPNRCSECEVNGDCGAQRSCEYNIRNGYASCVGTGALGNICNNGGQCESNFCAGGVCSQCEGDGDCTGGGSCIDDRNGQGYYVCAGGLGNVCTTGTDCNSGFCYDPPVGSDRCSECETSQDCPNNGTCAPNLQLTYAVCY
jgi:Notch-like protein